MKQKLLIAVSALVVMVVTAFGVRSLRRDVGATNPHNSPPAERQATTAPGPLARQYVPGGLLGGKTAFAERLAAVAVDDRSYLYAAGDREVRVFDYCATPIARYALSSPPQSITVGPDRRIYVGQEGQVEVLDAQGKPAGVIGAGVLRGDVSAVAIVGGELWAAQLIGKGEAGGPAVSRIARFKTDGAFLGEFDGGSRLGGFNTPNGRLDFSPAADGQVVVTNPGTAHVEFFSADGKRQSSWGFFSRSDEKGFFECCNPMSVAVGPGGLVVTAEKTPARVKVYTAAGDLLAILAPELFQSDKTPMDVAIDSHGRIFVADTEARAIRLFVPLE